MTDIEQRTQALEDTSAMPSPDTGAELSAEVSAQIHQLQNRIDALERAPDVTPESVQVPISAPEPSVDEGRVNQLEMRLALMEEAVTAMQGQDLTQPAGAALLAGFIGGSGPGYGNGHTRGTPPARYPRGVDGQTRDGAPRRLSHTS